MSTKPVLILSARGRPIEIGVIISCLLTGLFGFIFPPSPTIQAISAAIPIFEVVWYGGIGISSLIALVSVFLRIPESLIWERIGLTLLATFLAGYSFLIISFLGLPGVRGTIIVIMFVGGFAFRVRQITRDLRLLEQAIEESQ